MFKTVLLATVAVACVSTAAMADTVGNGVSDEVIAKQRATLAIETDGKGYSPQSPRDIEARTGENHRIFGVAPAVDKMTLCDIHFHESAEHKGGMFTRYAGNGDGHGYGTGFKYDGKLTEDELAPIGIKVGHWQVPAEVRVDEFRRWKRGELRGHKPRTRIIGSWNYRPL